MPHVTLQYTANLEPEVDMPGLCRALATTLVGLKDEAGGPLYPTGGTRVLAYPAAHCAVSDGGAAGLAAGLGGDYAFVYMNVRMARGRSAVVHQRVGEALNAVVKERFAEQLARRPIGITVQVDEGTEVFDAKNSSLHPLFNKA